MVRGSNDLERFGRYGGGAVGDRVEEDAYIVELVAGFLYLPVGIQLLARARRSGGLPERLLGLAFSCWGMGYIGYEGPGLIPALAAVEMPLYHVGRVFFAGGCLAIALFTQRVFRPEARWAAGLTWTIGLLFAVALLWPPLRGSWAMVSIGDLSFWLELAAMAIPCVWMGVEGYSHYARARRRLRLGIEDAITCNRFALWGHFGLLQLAVTGATVPMYLAYETSQRITGAMDALVGGLELLSIAMLWLAFAPPAIYRDWVAEASAETAT